jgi:hypothetical protein
MGFRIAGVFVCCKTNGAASVFDNFGASLCVRLASLLPDGSFLDYSISHYYICCRGAEA